MTTAAITAGLDGPAHFLTWGPLQISVANLVTIALIVVLFVLAIVLPFPKPRSRR
jgi:energy-coupling factor transporter transmembrane protein EcfT